MAKAITLSDLRSLAPEAAIAVRVVGFDKYGRGFSGICFNRARIEGERGRLSRLGYHVGLVDVRECAR